MVIIKEPAVLHSLVYVSTAQVLFTPARFEELLNRSRIHNAREGITGVLLFRDGAFMQLLEGPEPAVEKLFQQIKTDERHFAVTTLSEEAVKHRRFPRAAMGFRNLRDTAVRQLPGFAEFAETSLSAAEFGADPAKALKLIRLFEGAA